MVRPSNPRLMARVLDAVMNLGDTRGSSAREVLTFIRKSNVSPKNLTVQVHRALKHAVNAGLLRHRSGRYKTLATLNSTSVPPAPTSKESTNGDRKTEEKKSKSDVQPPPIGDPESSSRQTRERKKKPISRRRNSRHRSSKARKRSRRGSRSPYPRPIQNRKRRQRKRTYDDEEFEDQSSGRYILHARDDESPVPFNRKTKRSRVSKRELESDFSDESDRESDVNRKRVSRSSKPLCREPKRKETQTKSRGKSTSRARSPQLQRTMQARQYPIEEVGNDRQQCDENRESTERDVARQEAHEEEDVEGAREPNDSNSGSTLENSKD